jgi:hypothetical protein
LFGLKYRPFLRGLFFVLCSFGSVTGPVVCPNAPILLIFTDARIKTTTIEIGDGGAHLFNSVGATGLPYEERHVVDLVDLRLPTPPFPGETL